MIPGESEAHQQPGLYMRSCLKIKIKKIENTQTSNIVVYYYYQVLRAVCNCIHFYVTGSMAGVFAPLSPQTNGQHATENLSSNMTFHPGIPSLTLTSEMCALGHRQM